MFMRTLLLTAYAALVAGAAERRPLGYLQLLQVHADTIPMASDGEAKSAMDAIEDVEEAYKKLADLAQDGKDLPEEPRPEPVNYDFGDMEDIDDLDSGEYAHGLESLELPTPAFETKSLDVEDDVQQPASANLSGDWKNPLDEVDELFEGKFTEKVAEAPEATEPNDDVQPLDGKIVEAAQNDPPLGPNLLREFNGDAQPSPSDTDAQPLENKIIEAARSPSPIDDLVRSLDRDIAEREQPGVPLDADVHSKISEPAQANASSIDLQPVVSEITEDAQEQDTAPDDPLGVAHAVTAIKDLQEAQAIAAGVAVNGSSYSSSASGALELEASNEGLAADSAPASRNNNDVALLCIFMAFCGAVLGGGLASQWRKVSIAQAAVAGAVVGCAVGYSAASAWGLVATAAAPVAPPMEIDTVQPPGALTSNVPAIGDVLHLPYASVVLGGTQLPEESQMVIGNGTKSENVTSSAGTGESTTMQMMFSGAAMASNQTAFAQGESASIAAKLQDVAMASNQTPSAQGENVSIAANVQDVISQARAMAVSNPYRPLRLDGDDDAYLPILEAHLAQSNVRLPMGVSARQSRRMGMNAKPLIWLHIHQEAGSFACLAAVANGERVVAPSTGCSWEPRDAMWTSACTSSGCTSRTQSSRNSSGGIGSGHFKPVSCEERALFYQQGNFTFGSIQRELHKSDLCPEFRYATTLRDPAFAVESRLIHDWELLKASADFVGANTKPDPAASVTFPWIASYVSTVFDRPWNASKIYGLPGWKLLDNFKIRTILGDEAFNLAPGMIGPEHVDAAIARLEKFHLVKVVGGVVNESEEVAEMFSWDGRSPKIGWDMPVGVNVNTLARPQTRLIDPLTKQKLHHINKYDRDLFNHFAAKAISRASTTQTPALRTQESTPPPIAAADVWGYKYLKLENFSGEYFDGTYMNALEDHIARHGIAATNGLSSRQAKRRATGEKPIIWLHIHKEAGSFACLAAVANGERVVAPSKNCNWKPYDSIWTGECNPGVCGDYWEVNKDSPYGIGSRHFQGVPCEARRRQFAEGNFTFGSIEREFHTSDICPDFRYATSLREPKEVLESRLVYDQKGMRNSAHVRLINTDEPDNATQLLPWLGSYLTAEFDNPSNATEVYGLPGWKLLDNYKIRTILGDEAFNLPPGKIGPEHLDLAIRRLEKFHLVKLASKVDESLRWDGRAPKIGWVYAAGSGQILANARSTHDGQRVADDVWQRLVQINKYDIQLYEHFAQKQKNRL